MARKKRASDENQFELQFDLSASVAERDKALTKVEVNAGDSFVEGCLSVISAMDNGARVTGEDIRRACVKAKIKPHHPNAWGAMIGVAIRRGLMFRSGAHRKMKAKSSHARMTPVYVVWRPL